VPIGTRWEPRPRSSITDEELFIQAHLLAKPARNGGRIAWAIAWVTAIAAYLVFAFTL
jgi:hypothetical protein